MCVLQLGVPTQSFVFPILMNVLVGIFVETKIIWINGVLMTVNLQDKQQGSDDDQPAVDRIAEVLEGL